MVRMEVGTRAVAGIRMAVDIPAAGRTAVGHFTAAVHTE
jgi:hypothetical protein